MEKEPLITVYINKSKKTFDGCYPLLLEVSFKGKKKILKTLYELAEEEFARQVIVMNKLQKKSTEKQYTPLYLEIMRVKYLICKLEKVTKDYTVTEVSNLYKQNREACLLEPYLKASIRRMKAEGGQAEARYTASLLDKVKEFFPKTTQLDIASLNCSWFDEFEKFLREWGMPLEAVNRYCAQMGKLYVRACQENGLKVLYPFGPLQCTSVTEIRTEYTPEVVRKLKEASFEDSKRYRQARDVFLFMYYVPDISLLDLIELKAEDIYQDKIWYRRSTDNCLCCIDLCADATALLVKNADSEDEAVFSAPIRKGNVLSHRTYIKLRWYNKQMKCVAKLLDIRISWVNLNLTSNSF